MKTEEELLLELAKDCNLNAKLPEAESRIDYSRFVIKEPTIRCAKHGTRTRPFTVQFSWNDETKNLVCCQECLHEHTKALFDSFPGYEVIE